MASTATGVDRVRGTWCRALAADYVLVPWAPQDPSVTIRVSAPAESAMTGSGARDVPRVTTGIRGAVLAAAI